MGFEAGYHNAKKFDTLFDTHKKRFLMVFSVFYWNFKREIRKQKKPTNP